MLVLGSFPSAASLAAGQYYAHKQNAFWLLMGVLFAAGIDLPYAERVARLHAHGIAVWDVLGHCRRAGSLDANIERSSEQPNDFARLFVAQPQLRRIALNGKKAAECLARHAAATVPAHCSVRLLPSTSAANATWSFDRKLRAWRAALLG